MAAGPTLSGKEGKVYKAGSPDTEIEIMDWSFTAEVDTDRFATSKSDGYKVTKGGNKGATGSVNGKRVTDTPIATVLDEGDEVTLKLEFTAGSGISVPAVIKNLSYTVNVDTGEVEAYSFNYESSGAYSYY